MLCFANVSMKKNINFNFFLYFIFVLKILILVLVVKFNAQLNNFHFIS